LKSVLTFLTFFFPQPRKVPSVGNDLSTPHGAVSFSKNIALDIGSGHGRGRPMASEAIPNDGTTSLQDCSVILTPTSGTNISNADLSLHHIDSIRTPLDFGSPVLP
jgi:hypothetical protein